MGARSSQRLRYASAARYQVEDQDYQSNNQQYVDQSSTNVQAEAEQPKNQQNDQDCPKHDFLFRGVVSTREDCSSRMHRHIQVQLVFCSDGLRLGIPDGLQERLSGWSSRDFAKQYISSRYVTSVNRLH